MLLLLEILFSSRNTMSKALLRMRSLSLCSLSLERIWENANISLNRALVPQELYVSTINPNLAFSTLFEIFVTAERGEAPVLRDNDLLTAGELVL